MVTSRADEVWNKLMISFSPLSSRVHALSAEWQVWSRWQNVQQVCCLQPGWFRFQRGIKGVQSLKYSFFFFFCQTGDWSVLSSLAETWKNCLDGATDFKEVNDWERTQVLLGTCAKLSVLRCLLSMWSFGVCLVVFLSYCLWFLVVWGFLRPLTAFYESFKVFNLLSVILWLLACVCFLAFSLTEVSLWMLLKEVGITRED